MSNPNNPTTKIYLDSISARTGISCANARINTKLADNLPIHIFTNRVISRLPYSIYYLVTLKSLLHDSRTIISRFDNLIVPVSSMHLDLSCKFSSRLHIANLDKCASVIRLASTSRLSDSNPF